ncbi:HAD domain-containing protein [Streptomyces sp. MI02-7b]|uniref:HAD domain-containing protein n=1 Tax=Streptomyces sp. MI02-7b TaxID=462941 RepID=UPI0029BE2AC4|nr:HAD domain-containing protein [Streptomyces sp. MI02-7b]MDX3070971.1 HAD domain-containing protein [Streptomyces sp. MI02-7b]
MPRPLLFLDIDGPLIPFGSPAGRPAFPAVRPSPGRLANPLLDRIDPALGPTLAALPCELVWATSWTAEDANASVAPRLGLPALPAVTWPEPSADDARDERAGLHWKTRTLLRRAAGRPFAWVDDETTGADRDWVAAQGALALLHGVDPRQGLTERDFAVLAAWLSGAAPSIP